MVVSAQTPCTTYGTLNQSQKQIQSILHHSYKYVHLAAVASHFPPTSIFPTPRMTQWLTRAVLHEPALGLVPIPSGKLPAIASRVICCLGAWSTAWHGARHEMISDLPHSSTNRISGSPHRKQLHSEGRKGWL